MCRLVGIVASETTEFALSLKEAPRSLASLSREHPDGWGIAVFEHHRRTWRVHKGIERAYEDQRFLEIAARSAGHVLVAHVRQKTVGATRIENTHPFERDGWIFAHNGTVIAVDTLRAGASPARLAEVTGDTDSEVLFAHLLTRLDEAGLTHLPDEDARAAATILLDDVTRRLREANVGAFNFLLSDGRTCFAHRFGRSLYLLERTPGDVLVASDRLTDEPWREVPEGTFLRMDRDPAPAAISAEPGRAA